MVPILSLATITLGAMIAYRLYSPQSLYAQHYGHRQSPPQGMAGLSYAQLYLPWVYQKATQGLYQVSQWVAYCDAYLLDAFYHRLAQAYRSLATFTTWVDRALVDAGVRGLARGVAFVGQLTRSTQDGNLQHYILWTLVTLVTLIIALLSFSHL